MYRVISGFLLALPLIAQSSRGDLSFGGVVVNSATGEPVKNATVIVTSLASLQKMVEPPASPKPLVPDVKTARSTHAGEFHIDGLKPGQIVLAATKPGFNEYSNLHAVLKGENFLNLTRSVKDFEIKLAPLGVIEGRVTDQDGEPIPGVEVAQIMRNVVEGRVQPRAAQTWTTDDRGDYRIANLRPGKYYLKALGKTGAARVFTGERSNAYDSWESFASIYSDGSADISAAAPIVIEAGTVARADFRLKLETAYQIRGTINNYRPHSRVQFQLLKGHDPVKNARATLNGVTGAFEIFDVLPGTYTLRATLGYEVRGESTVTVGKDHINGLTVTLSSALPLRTTHRIIGAASLPSPKPSGRGRVRDNQPNCGASLIGTDAAFGIIREGRDDGTLYFPGEYDVSISCSGGYAISATWGSVDLLTSPKITIQAGVEPPPIDITIKSGGGNLKVKIDGTLGEMGGGSLLVPMVASSGGPVWHPVFQVPAALRQFAPAEIIEASGLQINNLAPGDYLVYLFASSEQIEYRNPAILSTLTDGVKVHIDEGQTTEVTLTKVIR